MFLRSSVRRSVLLLKEPRKYALMSALIRGMHLDLELCQVFPQECPFCRSTEARFRPKGSSAGVRRYICGACGRRFTYHPAEVMRGSHLPINIWNHQVEDYFDGYTVEASAERDGISTNTVQRVRHVISDFILDLLQEGTLEGIFPAEETPRIASF